MYVIVGHPHHQGTDGENYRDESDWLDVNGNFLNGESPTPYGAGYLPIPQVRQ